MSHDIIMIMEETTISILSEGFFPTIKHAKRLQNLPWEKATSVDKPFSYHETCQNTIKPTMEKGHICR